MSVACIVAALMRACAQVKILRENTANVAAALENEAAECLRHARVDRVSAKVYVLSGDTHPFEADAVVVTDTCAAVAEVKTVLNELAAVQLLRNVRIIKYVHASDAAPRACLTQPPHPILRSELKDKLDCPPELRMFAGKRIIPVLAGRIIKPLDKSITAEQLVAEWRAAGISLLLPSGAGLGFHDGCFQAAPFDTA